MKTTRVVLLCVECWMYVSLANAYIWGMMLNNPSPEGVNKRNEQTNGTETPPVRCRSDETCGEGNFCDLHYGYCDTYRDADEPCRKDVHCKSSFICLFGRCQRPVKRGHKGARCISDSDCRRNLCCARQHGERVCKQKLQRGFKCYVPDGGLDYSINEMCPCEEGLICSTTEKKTKQNEKLEWDYWSSLDTMRCSPLLRRS